MISRDLGEFFVEQCEYCTRPPFLDPRAKAEHYLRRHLKLLSVNKDKFIIRKICEKYIEFSIDYARFGKVYNFKNLGKVLNEFIDNVARVIADANDEFRLICCIVNQSAVESHGRRLFTNSCFTTGIIEGLMNDRVKEFLFLNTKKRVLVKGQNGSNVYFYRFDFLKIHFLTSRLRNYIGIVQT